MNEINDYLSAPNPDYQTGISLFEKYGGDSRLLHIFKNSRPQNYFGFLKSELKKKIQVKALNDFKIEIPAAVIKESSTSFKKEKPKDSNAGKSIEWLEVAAYKTKKYKELASLRNSLTDILSGGERALAVDEVMRLVALNKKLWYELDYYDKHRKWKDSNPLDFVKDDKPNSEVDKVELLRRLTGSLRPKITRAKKRLGELELSEGKEHHKYLKKEKELALAEAERDEIERILGLK